MKKILLLYIFRLKSACKSVPRILIATLIFSIIVAAIGYTGTKLLYSEKEDVQMNIALVLPLDSDFYTKAAFSFLNEIDTVKNYCSFKEMSKEEAFKSLKNKSVQSIILVPDNFIDHILDGTNTPATVILPKSGKTSSSPLFRALVTAGVGDLAVAQAGIYAVDDALIKNDLRNEISTAEFYLNDTYLSYALDRSIYFENNYINATGGLTLTQFYIQTGILLLLMFSLIACIDLFSVEKQVLRTSFKRRRIPIVFIQGSKTFSVTFIFSVIGIIAAIILQEYFILDITSILLIIFAIYCTVLLAQTILIFTENLLAKVLLLFMAILVMMFVSGSIVPEAFLPVGVNALAPYMPTTWILRLITCILTGFTNYAAIYRCILICVISKIIQYVIYKSKI